jgi:hypothetical protein
MSKTMVHDATLIRLTAELERLQRDQERASRQGRVTQVLRLGDKIDRLAERIDRGMAR